MKTKLICLALVMIFLLSGVLTACGKKTDQEATEDIMDAASANTRHLSMWVVAEAPVSPETASAVTAALNDITMTKFSTKLTIQYLTEAEYRDVLTKTIRANEDARNPLLSTGNDVAVEESTATGEVETVTNKYGLPEKKYDALRANQVDIIYIQGEDMYAEYIGNGWLTALDSELSAASKKIKEYVSATLLSAVKYNGVTYAIPNNTMVGEYTYMLLDKELMEECSMDGPYNQGKIDGFFNDYMYNYLQTVHDHYYVDCECHKDAEKIVPIDASYEEISKLLAHYWSFDPATYEIEEKAFSVLGYRYTDPKTLSQGQTVLSFNSLFADPVFSKNFLKINEFRLAGNYYVDVAEGERAAVKFCTGTIADYEKLAEDYYPVIVKYPTVKLENEADQKGALDSMFGVCAYSIDAARSMEIITYLNTNADFRNILQYGVEGEHYELEGEGSHKTVRRLNENYKMDLFKTGNAFIAYPELGMDADVWEVGKKQNREALIEPLYYLDIAQLAKNEAKPSETAPAISGKGYQYSFKTGYAKETLMENALLNKWISDSDAAGSGVYVYHTSKTDGQNVTGQIYYYNNNISGANVSMSDADGAVSVNYSGTAGNGYELTVVSFWGKKNSSKLAWNATVNGAGAPTRVTYQNSVLKFDFFETQKYDIEFTTGISKSMLNTNTAVWNEIGPSIRSLNQPKTFAWTYKAAAEGDATKSVYTYLFFAYADREHSVVAKPVVKDGVLTIDIDYTSGKALAADSTSKYACFLVTATVDATITDVKFDVSVDGGAPTNLESKTFAADPKFVLCGTLDTELIKFINQLNADVEKMINDCTTIEELTAVVEDLAILLKPQSYPFNVDINGINDIPSKMKSDKVSEYVSGLSSMEDFYWNLHIATSKDDVKRMAFTEADPTKTEEVKENSKTGEPYYYFRTPYALYYSWLKSNGFVKK